MLWQGNSESGENVWLFWGLRQAEVRQLVVFVTKTSQIRAELVNVGPGNDEQNQPSFSIAVAFRNRRLVSR